MRDPTVGVYIHVPFCERICPYCDFAVVRAPTLAAARERETVDALRAELARRSELFAGLRLATIYLGGGTPSLLQPESIAALIAGARAAFDPASEPELEVTLEVNPSTLERARLPGFREAGVNRLSIGVQSFDDGVLHRLGRAHRGDEGGATVRAARAAGFENLSLDLIFGAPDQDLAGVQSDLEQAVALAPRHVSAYALTIEEGTPFALAARRGQLRLPEPDVAAAMMETVEARLEAAGLARYEVSSFATAGHASRHNQRYWRRAPVLGLGPGAWSSEPPGSDSPHGARRANVRALDTWLARVRAGEPAEVGPPEVLDPRTARGEAIWLSLRTSAGANASDFAKEFGGPPRVFFARAIDELLAGGLLDESEGGDLRLTRRGRLLADLACEHFV